MDIRFHSQKANSIIEARCLDHERAKTCMITDIQDAATVRTKGMTIIKHSSTCTPSTTHKDVSDLLSGRLELLSIVRKTNCSAARESDTPVEQNNEDALLSEQCTDSFVTARPEEYTEFYSPVNSSRCEEKIIIPKSKILEHKKTEEEALLISDIKEIKPPNSLATSLIATFVDTDEFVTERSLIRDIIKVDSTELRALREKNKKLQSEKEVLKRKGDTCTVKLKAENVLLKAKYAVLESENARIKREYEKRAFELEAQLIKAKEGLAKAFDKIEDMEYNK